MRALISIVILLIILASVPFIDGYFFKQNFLDLIHSREYNSIKIEVQEYKLGWLCSEAKIRVTPVDENMRQYFADGLTINEHIMHGPVIYDQIAHRLMLAYAFVTTELYFPKTLQDQYLSLPAGQPVWKTNSRVSFDNTWTMDNMTDTLVIKNVGTFKILNASSSFQYQIEKDSLKAYSEKVKLDNFTLLSDKQNQKVPDITVQDVRLNQDATKQAAGLWNGNGTTSVSKFFVKWVDNKTVNMENLSGTGNQGIGANGLYNTAVKVTIAKLETPNNVLPVISALNLNFSLNNLDPKGLTTYMAFFYDHPHLTKEDVAQIAPLLLSIITPTTNVNFAIQFNSDSGAASLQITAAPQQGGTGVAAANVASNMRIASQLLAKLLEAGINFKENRAAANNAGQTAGLPNQPVLPPDSTPQPATPDANSPAPAPATPAQPNAAAAQAQEMINTWLTQGYLVQDGSDLTSQITFADGVLKINGKVINSAAPASPPTPATSGTQPQPPMPSPQMTPPPAP